MPLFEVMTMTDEIALLVGAPTREIEAMAVSQGMFTLREDGVRLAARGHHDARGDPPGRGRRGQLKPRQDSYSRLGFEAVASFIEAAPSSSVSRLSAPTHDCGPASALSARAQRCPKWCGARERGADSSSATRRASAPRVSIEVTRMLRFSPTRS